MNLFPFDLIFCRPVKPLWQVFLIKVALFEFCIIATSSQIDSDHAILSVANESFSHERVSSGIKKIAGEKEHCVPEILVPVSCTIAEFWSVGFEEKKSLET